MAPKAIETQSEFEEVLEEAGDTKLVAIDFHAEWCGPCKMIGPKFAAMSEEAQFSKFIFIKIDVDENEEVAGKYDITAMPTFIIVNNKGDKIDDVIGANEAKLKLMLEKHA